MTSVDALVAHAGATSYGRAMTRRPAPHLFEVAFTPDAQRELAHLPPRTRDAVLGFLQTSMREDPEQHGVRLLGGSKGRLLVERADFRIVYAIDHPARRVFILRIESS